jgi:hypothetical protein
MSAELTDKAIESSKKAEEMASKPVLSTKQFVENVEKLKNHFEQIEVLRDQIAKEATIEREVFEEAKTKLEGIKVMNKAQVEEFSQEVLGNEAPAPEAAPENTPSAETK